MRFKNVPAVSAAVAAVVYSALPLAFSLVLALSGAAHADTIYWDNSGGTAGSWADVANWSTVVGGGSNPSAIPGSSDVATFSATPIQGINQSITLGANRSVLGLDILSGVTANTVFTRFDNLTIGASGITNAGSGNVSIDPNVVFAANQSIANNGSGNIQILNDISGTSVTITNNGTGTGSVSFNSFQGDTIAGNFKIAQDSATSTLRMRISAPLFTGPVEIKKGILNTGNSNTNLGTGTVTLGNAAGGSDAATLELVDNGNVSLSNPIELASNTTGTLTIRLLEDQNNVSHNKTLTGGITGTNSLTIQNNGGDDTISFTTNAINNAGTLTHTGTGTGLTTINSVIGSNVTGVTQNSTTSTLVLGGTNLYSGPTTVSSGALRLANQNAVQNSTVTMGGGAGAALVFSSTVSGNAFTLGGLAAASAGAGYDISLLNNAGSPAPIALTVGGNNASTTYAGVLSGTGGSLIKAGTGTLNFTGTGSYTGATQVNAGSLLVSGLLSTTDVTVNGGGLLGGLGGMLQGNVAVASSGTISPGNFGGVGTLTVGSLSLAAGSSTLMGITGVSSSLYDQLVGTGTGGLTYGGNLDLVLSGSYATGTTWNLFSNFLTETGDFAAVGLTATGEYAGLTFTGASGVWTSTTTANNQYLEFTQSTGNLVVVPEPSTIAMALAGLACGGWQVARRRRRLRQAASLSA
jgi:autotransporter-associated beta strand protein